MMKFYNADAWSQRGRDIMNTASLDDLIKIINEGLSRYEWFYVFKSDAFDEKIYEMFNNDIPWDIAIITRHGIKIDCLEEHYDELDKYTLSMAQDLSYDFIKKHKDELSLDVLAQRDNLKDFNKIKELYTKLSDRKHKIIWENNLKNSPIFGAVSQAKIKNPIENKKEKEDYDSMSKQQLKEILGTRGIRVFYHDTIPMLIEKCRNSEPSK